MSLVRSWRHLQRKRPVLKKSNELRLMRSKGQSELSRKRSLLLQHYGISVISDNELGYVMSFLSITDVIQNALIVSRRWKSIYATHFSLTLPHRVTILTPPKAKTIV